MSRLRLLLVMILSATPLAAPASVPERVAKQIQECTAAAASGDEQYYCLLKATPRKCRHHVRDRRLVMSMSLRQQWQTCLASCEGATFYQRTFGACSTPSDPDK